MSDQKLAVSGSILFITIAAMLASLMAVLDISIVNVAINDIRSSFGVQIDQIAWISTGYMMANVIVIPLTGWFQKRFGLKNYFTFSVVLFTFASFCCGISWNLTSLTLFRILQGAGGGAIIPTASTILMSRYPKEQQGMAQAFIGLGALTGPLLGPSIGGYLIDISSWHWIFLINLPIGILAAGLAFHHIKEESFTPTASSLDYYGVALLIVGLGSLQFVLEEGSRHDWLKDHLILFLSIVCFVSLVTLIVHQLESKEPMINFRVFWNRNYFLSSVINFFLGVTLFSGSFFFSLFCSTVLNYTPLDIGILFLKGSFIQIIMMPLVGKIVSYVDARSFCVFGIGMVVTSIFLNARLTDQANQFSLVLILFLRSIGLAFVFIPLSLVAVEQIDRKELGNAVGLFNLTRELGGSIGLAVMSSMLVNHMTLYRNYLRAYFTSSNEAFQQQMQLMKGLFSAHVDQPERATYAFFQNKISLQAMIQSFNYCFEILAALFFVSGFVVFLLKKMDKNNSKIDVELLH